MFFLTIPLKLFLDYSRIQKFYEGIEIAKPGRRILVLRESSKNVVTLTAKELDTLSKNNLPGIALLRISHIWRTSSLTLHPLSVRKRNIANERNGEEKGMNRASRGKS